MQAFTPIGLDIAKSVFQVRGIDAEGKVLIGLEKRIVSTNQPPAKDSVPLRVRHAGRQPRRGLFLTLIG
jgi:hypothetical protein